MNKPALSVVIPVYNAGKFLMTSIGSIIDQTFQDWEMICVNDGSTDESKLILEWFARNDSRIRVVHQQNAGLVCALNRGHEMVLAQLICRMDADDIAMPTRLAHQFEFMSKNPNHVAVSGSILEMDIDSEPLGVQSLARDHDTIVQRLLRRKTGLFHPASIMRSDALRRVGGYRPEYQWIEDHDLWLRLSEVGQLGNTDEIVLCYRQHAASGSWQKSNRQRELTTLLLKETHARMGIACEDSSLATPPSRSDAGPGKWARKAIRGGYPQTAIKHLRLLWKEKGLTWYTLRMFAEVAMRLPAAVRTNRRNAKTVQVPTLSRWNTHSPTFSA